MTGVYDPRMPALTIRPTVRPARAEELIDLRHRVLRAGLARESAIFEGDDDPRALHFVATDADGSVIGCATIVPSRWEDQPSWRLRGMAVDEGSRSKGIGGALLRAVEDSVRTSNGPAPHLWCNARTPAVGFYKRHGWAVVSDEFNIETAGPHFKMTRTVGS